MPNDIANVLFEAFVHETNSYTTFYYIETFEGCFLFKKGISKLGAVIQPYENNRLSIAVGSKEDYKAFISEMQKVIEQNCAFGHDEFYHWFYRFKYESDIAPDAPSVKGAVSVVNIFERHFDRKIDIIRLTKDKVVIDTFKLDMKNVQVVHDVQFNWMNYIDKKKELMNDKEMEMLMKKHFFGYEKSEHEAIKEKYDLMMEYPDLTKELLYVLDSEKYPHEVITVDGWTAKDLIECADCDVAEAYFHMMNLRKNPKTEAQCLYEWFKISYPGLYEQTGIQKELQLIKEMAEKKNAADRAYSPRVIDLERAALDEGIPMQTPNGVGARPSVSQWIEIGRTKGGKQNTKPITRAKYKEFLSKYTIPMIQKEIKKYIIGQDDLIEHVSTFIYYHALRQVKPVLHPRPFLIAGPSGSGKTEAFRVVKNIFKDYFNVEIVDGTTITQEGWKGMRKLSAVLGSLSDGYILVIDEFDKLAKPAFDSGNNNVSEHIQAEFLKLLEGEYYTKDLKDSMNQKARKEVSIDYDTRTLGIVLVGAFEAIRSKKENPPTKIGFMQNSQLPKAVMIEEPVHESEHNRSRVIKPNSDVESFMSRSERVQTKNKSKATEITDEDLIKYGVITELVGRIADKCTTNKLTVEQYIQIVKNENSKVSQLMKELEEMGIATKELLSDELISSLVEESQTNLLGVRWVSSQVESILLKQLCEVDIRELFKEKPAIRDEDIEYDSFSIG